MTLRFLSLWTMLLCVLSAPAVSLAAGYTVNNIHSSKSAKNGEQARDKALAEAERKAFVQLMNRLNNGQGETLAAKTPASRISAMVTEMQINNERVTGAYYAADFSFTFHQGMADAAARGNTAARRSVFTRPATQNGPAFPSPYGQHHRRDERESAYGYAPERPKRPTGSVYIAGDSKKQGPAMLLPVLEEGGAARQWEQESPWIEAWRGLSSGNLFYVVPSRSAPILHPSMLEYIRLGNLTEEDRLRIVRFLQPYGPSGFSYMMYGQYRYDQSQQSAVLDAQLYEISPNFRSVFEHSVKMGIGEDYEVFIDRAAQVLFEKARPYVSAGNADDARAYKDIYDAGRYAVQTREVPACNPATAQQPYSERLIVSAYSLQQWLSMKQKLQSAVGIVGVSSVSMTPGRMMIDLVHQCDSGEALANTVSAVGLSYDPGEGVIFTPEAVGYRP